MGSHRVGHDWSDLVAAACPLSQWCYLTISSFATLFSFCFSLSQHHSLFCWVSSLHQAVRVLELELQHQSFKWVFRVDLRIDWFDLLAVQGTLKNLLKHHNLKASILWHSAFFMIQFSPYMTTGKTIALTIWTFVGKVMSLIFNMLSSFVITFLPRCKHLLILCLPSPFALTLELKKMKSETVSTFSPSILTSFECVQGSKKVARAKWYENWREN